MRQPASIEDLLATSHRKTSSSSGWDPLSQERRFWHLNVRPIEVVKWSTIQVQKSTIYLQSALQLNRRLRGRGRPFPVYDLPAIDNFCCFANCLAELFARYLAY